MKAPENPFVFKLDQIVLEGDSGEVGPLTLEMARGDDRVISLKNPRDGETLIHIIKGIIPPREGRVIKKSGEATGWIVRDGIIALVGEDFFSKTVEDEIAFAVRVGEAKELPGMEPFVPGILGRSGFASRLKEDIASLSRFEKQMLVLASALCMLPDCLILVDSFRGFGEDEVSCYLDLLRYGKEMVGFATLRIISGSGIPILSKSAHEFPMRREREGS